MLLRSLFFRHWLALAATVLITVLGASASLLFAQASATPGIIVLLGGSAQRALQPNDTITIPVIVDASPTAAAATNLASLTAIVSWSPCLELLSAIPGNFGVLTQGAVQVGVGGTGSQQISIDSPTGTKSAFALMTYVFRAMEGCHLRTAARGRMLVTLVSAGNQTGASVRDLVARSAGPATAPIVSASAICVGYRGAWGAVRDNQVPNILDAQQIARWTVNLPVFSPDRLPAYGDVTNDGVVDILDAQQVARFALALSTSSRTGQPGPNQCAEHARGAAQSVQMAQGAALALTTGHSVRLSAMIADDNPWATPAIGYGRFDFSPIQWSVSDTSLLSVDSDALVTAKRAGTADVLVRSARGSIVVNGRMQFVVDGDPNTTPATPMTLSVTSANSGGAGRVMSSPPGIDCTVTASGTTGTCQFGFPAQTIVTISGAAASGSVFMGWSGSTCSSTKPCSFTTDAARAIGAGFATTTGQQTVTVAGGGNGTGTVTSSPAGIYCSLVAGVASGTCSMTVPTLSSVTFSASPSASSIFGGWGGVCSGKFETCTVSANEALNVQAAFDPSPDRPDTLWLTMRLDGSTAPQTTYAGHVAAQSTLTPTVSCDFPKAGSVDATCGPYLFPHGQQITLSFSSSTGAMARAWEGGCGAFAQDCQLTMTSTRRVTVNMAPTKILNISTKGNGTLTYEVGASAPERCLGTCQLRVPTDIPLTLVASPDSGSVFWKWASANYGCTVISVDGLTCVILDGATQAGLSMVADFQPLRTLVLRGSNDGSGRVTPLTMSGADGRPMDFNDAPCVVAAGAVSGNCKFTVPESTFVALTAQPDSANSIGTWMGACPDAGAAAICSFFVRDTVATVEFKKYRRLFLNGSGAGSGKVTGLASAPCVVAAGAISGECAQALPESSTVTLTAMPDSGSMLALATWSGACTTATAACSFKVVEGATATVAFDKTARLTVALQGDVDGSVKGSAPATISCTWSGSAQSGVCAEVYRAGTQVRLVAARKNAFGEFGGWTGVCAAATDTTCTVALSVDGTAGTSFTPSAWASLAAGSDHSCARVSSGDTFCWGSNSNGELGDGTTTRRGSPVAMTGGTKFASLTVGTTNTCGLTLAGAAYCWGSNLFGELGVPPTGPRSTPVAVSGALTFSSLTTSGVNTCGLNAAGAAYCWGLNNSGQLGDGTTSDRSTPVAVTGGLTFVALSAGGTRTCGLTSAGAPYCWGYNGDGFLGNNDPTTSQWTAPAAVTGGLTFATITAGRYNTCGVTTAGAAYCWGSNIRGAVGDGTTTDRFTPVAVSGGLAFANITVADGHVCGRTSAGIAYCWGGNSFGALGDGTTTNRLTPTAVSGGLTFSSLVTGTYRTCGLTTAGRAYCWGRNSSNSQLGDGTFIDRTAPVAVLYP